MVYNNDFMLNSFLQELRIQIENHTSKMKGTEVLTLSAHNHNIIKLSQSQRQLVLFCMSESGNSLLIN